jgi:hypothetical protein
MTSSGPTAETDTFLRHYWSSRKGVVRVKALYSQIKPTINTAQDAVEFAQDLAESGPLWSAMFDRDADVWQDYSPSAVAPLETLRNLNVEQCRPLLLAAMRRFEPSELEKLLELVVAWSVRWFVVGGGSGGVVERLYAEAARDINNGKFKAADEVAFRFQDEVPNDAGFQRAFREMTVRRGWLARYYLSALERAMRPEAEPELVPNQNVDEVNLEHVLPRNADIDEWPSFSAEEAQDMRLMLGNQVLLKKSRNTKLGNKPFVVKRPILASSDLLLTREVGEREEWTPDAIRARQERLAKLALVVWVRR